MAVLKASLSQENIFGAPPGGTTATLLTRVSCGAVAEVQFTTVEVTLAVGGVVENTPTPPPTQSFPVRAGSKIPFPPEFRYPPIAAASHGMSVDVPVGPSDNPDQFAPPSVLTLTRPS